MIVDQVRANFIKEIMKKSKRADDRQLLDYRPIKVEKNVLDNAEGSAIAHIGPTKVLAAVKFDLIAPFSDRPDEGVLMVGAEFPPLAHPDFESGPPNETSIELARVVDRGLRSAEAINLKELGQHKDKDGKVLGVFLDIYVMDHNGDLTDAAALAALAALNCARVPKVDVESGKLIRTESTGLLKLNRQSLTVTFSHIEGNFIVDATDEEEIASDGQISFGVTEDGMLCAGQKSGPMGLTKEKLVELSKIAIDLSKNLFSQI